MLFRFLSVALLVGSAFVNAAGSGGDMKGVSDQVEKDIRTQLGASLPELTITAIEKTNFSGLYEVSSANDQPLLVSEDGRYIIAGEVFQLDGHKIINLSEQKRETGRAAFRAQRYRLSAWKLSRAGRCGGGASSLPRGHGDPCGVLWRRD